MVRLRRIATVALVLVVLWPAGLLVADLALEGRTRQRVVDRLSESLQAQAAIERGDLALVRGALELDAISVRRDDVVGHLAITIASLGCDLPPLGAALFDRSCRELALRGTRLEISTAALFKLQRPKRPPLQVGRVVIDDARLELAASAITPSLGRIVVAIEHAEAGDTMFKTPLSWIFALHALRATVELPADITLRLSYEDGQLRIAGGIFGATPVTLPVTLPVRDFADDPAAEIAKLIAFGKDIAQQLFLNRAEDWLKAKLSTP